jgi:type I restriction enzyme S subunit
VKSLLLENFETLADTPSAIPKLRQLILQFAVRGRLVPQDPSDEPASELLKRITDERRRLDGQETLRRKSELPAVGTTETPHLLPASWQWARLGSITTYSEAAKVEPGAVRPGTWVLELEDIEKTIPGS